MLSRIQTHVASNLHLRLIIIGTLMLFSKNIGWSEPQSDSSARQLSESQTVGCLFQKHWTRFFLKTQNVWRITRDVEFQTRTNHRGSDSRPLSCRIWHVRRLRNIYSYNIYKLWVMSAIFFFFFFLQGVRIDFKGSVPLWAKDNDKSLHPEGSDLTKAGFRQTTLKEKW